MKIKDVIENLDKSEGNKLWVDWEDLADHFGIAVYSGGCGSTEERITKYPVASHLCTDTLVGLEAYFLDGEFVGMSSQTARKSSVNYEWVKELVSEVKLHVQQYFEEEGNIDFIDMEEDIGEGWSVDHTQKLIVTRFVQYEGKMYEWEKKDDTPYMVVLKSVQPMTVPVTECLIPFNLVRSS